MVFLRFPCEIDAQLAKQVLSEIGAQLETVFFLTDLNFADPPPTHPVSAGRSGSGLIEIRARIQAGGGFQAGVPREPRQARPSFTRA